MGSPITPLTIAFSAIPAITTALISESFTIENDLRLIGLAMARRLGVVLGVSYRKFLE
jgi:hypothetical protein